MFFGLRELFVRGGRDSTLKREVRRLPRLRDEDATGMIESFDGWFERTLYVSGTNLTPIEGALLVVLVTLAGAGAVFVATSSELFTLHRAIVVIGALLDVTLAREGRPLFIEHPCLFSFPREA